MLGAAVGAAVSVLSTSHPVALAKQAALLDHVSAGRFRLGAGRGGPWVDLEVFGTGLDRYESGFTESLDLLLAAPTQHKISAAGPTFNFREVAMVPRPRTRPHPPVVVACTSPAPAELAAERGLPMLLGMHTGDEGRQDMISGYTAEASWHGHPPASHIGAVTAYVADTRADARRVLQTPTPPGADGRRPGRSGPHPENIARLGADVLPALREQVD